ncbi:hypothetical protein TNIN_188601, partial [Trichonephila inaurata madagascariensis]
TISLKEREDYKSKKSESEKAEGVNGVTEGESKMVHTVKSQMFYKDPET